MKVSTQRRLAIASSIVLGLCFAFNAQAQTVGTEARRDLDQQERIDKGLSSGELSTREAAQLERGEAQIDRTEQRDLHDGSLSTADKAQIQREQNRESRAIYNDNHNATRGNPNSISSLRMQHDVGRDAYQDQRIVNGVHNGSLTNRELGRLDGSEARADQQEYRAGRDGHIGYGGQRAINRTQNRNSGRIWRDEHDGWNRR